jgi:large subunit ribosomal protein L5
MAEKKTKKENVQKEPKKGAKKAAEAEEHKIKIKTRLADTYRSKIVPDLINKFSYKNVMQVPKLEKIVINVGVGAAASDPKLMEEAVRDLESITGQKPSTRKAKKAISNFKLRAGMNIGAMVTLRKNQMYEFMDRLVNVALPRVRDFRGLSDKSFDGRGNYTMGVKEQIIFPEINVDKITKVLGMDITFVTTAKTDNEAYELLQSFGVPFRKKEIRNS